MFAIRSAESPTPDGLLAPMSRVPGRVDECGRTRALRSPSGRATTGAARIAHAFPKRYYPLAASDSAEAGGDTMQGRRTALLLLALSSLKAPGARNGR